MIVAFTLAMMASAKGQEARKDKFVSEEYDRSSLSVVILAHGDRYDNYFVPCVPELKIDSRFDVNVIPPSVRVWSSRNYFMPEKSLEETLNQAQVGKSVVSYLYNRKSDGSFDGKILKERGGYNKSQKDINIDMTLVSPSDSLILGEKLIDDSYVLVMDLCPDRDSLHVMTSLFRLAWNEDVMTDFYSNAWCEPSDPETVKAEKRKAYDLMRFSLEHVDTGTQTLIGWKLSDNQINWVQKAYYAWEQVIFEENSEFQVASTVVALKPIKARIGTKEGVKNGRRYGVYSYKETSDGQIVSKRQAYVRATVVGNNYSDPSITSSFYQISGAPMAVREGMVVKEKPDGRLGVTVLYQTGGLGDAVVAELDYLAHIGRHGGKAYAMFDFGYGLKCVDEYSNYRFSLGAGYGFPLTRFFELSPYIMIGADRFDVKDSAHDDELQFDSNGKMKTPGVYYAEPGLKLGLVIYPVSIVARLNYQLMVSKGMAGYDALNERYFGNKSGLAAQVGVKINF